MRRTRYVYQQNKKYIEIIGENGEKNYLKHKICTRRTSENFLYRLKYLISLLVLWPFFILLIKKIFRRSLQKIKTI